MRKKLTTPRKIVCTTISEDVYCELIEYSVLKQKNVSQCLRDALDLLIYKSK